MRKRFSCAFLLEKSVVLSAVGDRERPHPPPGHVITISRQLGSGGRQIAEELGKQLNWPVYDKEILELLAQESKLRYTPRMLEELDERIQNEIGTMISAVLGRADKYIYSHLLLRAVLSLAHKDGIILGRGAHLFLPHSLKVRIEASVETRVRNMVHFEGLTEREARRQIAVSDAARERFVRNLQKMFPERCRWFEHRLLYDLQINTDRMSIADASAFILEAAQRLLNPTSRVPLGAMPRRAVAGVA